MSWWQRRGLRFKIAVVVSLALILVLGGAVSGIVVGIRDYLYQREVEAAERTAALVVAGAESPMVLNRWDQVAGVITSVARDAGAPLDDVALYTRRGDPAAAGAERDVLAVFVTAFSEARRIPKSELDKSPTGEGCAVCHSLPSEARPATVQVSLQGQEVLRSSVPLQNKRICQGPECHSGDKKVLGKVLVDYRLDRYEQSANLITGGLAGGGSLAILLVIVAVFLLLNRMVVSPLHDLAASTKAVAQGEWERRVRVRGGDELGQLGSAFNDMTAQLSTTYTALQRAKAEQEEKATALQSALDEVERGHEAQDRLLQTIQEMATPVVPVHQGVLVMPLVGIIDSPRARGIIETLLAAIERQRARVVILDITGVPMVDTSVAQALLQAAQAARLLGAEAVLVGITPAVAETIVSLGVDLAELVTRADLQSGVAYAVERLGTRG